MLKRPVTLLLTTLFLVQILFAQSNNTQNANTIYVYKGPGAGENCVAHLLYTLDKEFIDYKIKTISPEEISHGTWKDHAALFVMPGGADVPYLQALKKIGMTQIKNYVRNGGKYLGICAGAYFAARDIEFAKGTSIEICGPRDLKFFPGTAVGPIFGPYYYASNKSVNAAMINAGPLGIFPVFYNGGCYFKNAETLAGCKILATYMDPQQQAAIIAQDYEKGRVVLSGVHFEFDAALLPDHDPYMSLIKPSLQAATTSRFALIKLIKRELRL